MVVPKLKSIAICGLAWTTAACSSGHANQHGIGDAGVTHSDGAAGVDGAADAGHMNAAPACQPGDRTEWSGTIPSTALAVAVCSACGETYVVAVNDGASAGEVSVDNGSKTITTNLAAEGTGTTAKLADNPSDGTVTVCGTAGGHSCLPALQNKRYCDPYRAIAGLVPERIDQGVDFGGSGSIYALGPGTIDVYQNRTNSGWPGGTFASYKLTDGPASGKTIYLAENVDLNPALKTGSVVFSGTVIGTLVDASPDSESGWGVAGASYTAEHSCYTEGCMTPLGVNFNDLLVCLKAPTGLMGQGGCCPAAAGWPTDWCSLLASWQ